MPLAVLLMICTLSLSAAVTPLMLAQVTDSRQSVTRGHARHAAQTGLQVAVAAVNAAYGTDPAQGDRTLLPCGPIAGVGDVVAAATYRVSLTYYDDDPTLPDSRTMTCAAARTGTPAPTYVRFTSTGTTTGGTPRKRSLRADYPLRMATATVLPPVVDWGPWFDAEAHPRLIPAWSSTPSTVCLDAGSGRPPAGRIVRLAPCNDDAPDKGFKQYFFYRPDLTIATVGSLLASQPMCLDAGAAPAAGVRIAMQPCVTPTPARQRWYYNAYRNFELAAIGSGPDGFALSGMCLNVSNPGNPSDLVLGAGGNCRSTSFNTRQTFSIHTKTGPGMAGQRPVDCTAAAGYPCTLTQLHNYGMPARCVERYTSFMADIECVQDPDPTKVRWSQLWRLPRTPDGPTGTVGPIVTVAPDGTTYCLTTATSQPFFPSQNACNPLSPSAAQRFTFYRNTGNEFTMYRIVDYRGLCVTHPNAQDDNKQSSWLYNWTEPFDHWKLRVSECINTYRDPSADVEFRHQSAIKRQKWNAPYQLPTEAGSPTPAPEPVPPSSGAPRLQNLLEIPPVP